MNQQYFDYAFTVNSGAVVTQISGIKNSARIGSRNFMRKLISLT